jgi:uncharacterized membrane protein YphA (DoxX/SURF4 family)
VLLVVLIRLAVAAVFIAAATAKFLGRDAFSMSVTSLTPMGDRAASVAVVGVPTAELIVGSQLLAGGWMPWTAVAAVGMLSLFSGVLVVALATRTTAACGCFGRASHGKPVTWRLVIRNAFLIVGCLWVATANAPASSSTAAWTGLGIAAATMLLIAIVKVDRISRRATSAP